MTRLVAALALLWLVAGCTSSPRPQAPRAPAPLPVATPALYRAEAAGGKANWSDRPLSARAARTSSPEVLLTGPLAGAPAASRRRGSTLPFRSLFRRPPSPQASAPAPIETRRAGARELYDIEARLDLEVENVAAARARVVELTRRFGGDLVNEVVEDTAHTRGASLSLRVPSERVHAFIAQLGRVGRVRSQKLETKEVGRKVNDAEILLDSLELARKRYEELLAKAADVAEAVQIENQLERVRTSIHRVQGDLQWLRDRVARSTVYVALTTPAEESVGDAEAKLHPGLRATLLVDVPPEGSARGFGGGGLSLRWSRHFSLDMDLMTSLSEAEGGAIDAFVATLGGELYSDFLGGGRRRWFNPYFGFRAGYARVLGENRIPLGGALGVEVFKSDLVMLDLQTRMFGLVGPDDGVHLGVQPLLGLHVAY